jgi:hypothetical protein
MPRSGHVALNKGTWRPLTDVLLAAGINDPDAESAAQAFCIALTGA